MMVTWVTLAQTEYSVVQYNKAGLSLTLQTSGTVTKFTDGGSAHRVLWMHRVKLTGLMPGQVYGMYSLLPENIWFYWLKQINQLIINNTVNGVNQGLQQL